MRILLIFTLFLATDSLSMPTTTTKIQGMKEFLKQKYASKNAIPKKERETKHIVEAVQKKERKIKLDREAVQDSGFDLNSAVSREIKESFENTGLPQNIQELIADKLDGSWDTEKQIDGPPNVFGGDICIDESGAKPHIYCENGELCLQYRGDMYGPVKFKWNLSAKNPNHSFLYWIINPPVATTDIIKPLVTPCGTLRLEPIDPDISSEYSVSTDPRGNQATIIWHGHRDPCEPRHSFKLQRNQGKLLKAIINMPADKQKEKWYFSTGFAAGAAAIIGSALYLVLNK